MGIHGLLPHLGPGERISLAKLSAQYFTKYNRPFRLAIDISIWLFQIQSGKGGSNPALRTFYYRLLRLMNLSIHPLFVFDGPNKPLFKRNKKVGGPGVKVATVPEFLAKQLLKEFGFPWHVAPGEAEAECALLQRESVVDAVLSEDVDTLMFGSGVTLRNWSQEGGAKGNRPPSHVNVYRAEETKMQSRGIDKEGMILVALMSGGDYIPEGVPGVGAKVACDAARAGFGKELCALHRKDVAGLKAWKERLETEIRTNASKFFSRKNNGFVMPEDFPSREVLGYYTHPCVSTPEKIERLRREVKWDLEIDFAGLRSFAGDAFDWRCKTGAKKFIKNLAPALLIRELRLRAAKDETIDADTEAQEASERQMVHAIHGKRNHATADGELEYRITFTPSSLVPIDLSLEEEDDEFTPAGGVADDSDVESELCPSTQAEAASAADENDAEAPTSPKKRQFRPYDPDQPEKIWILRNFLRIGYPLIVEDYEASTQDPREFLKQRRKAKAVEKGERNIHAPAPKQQRKKKAEKEVIPENALMTYARITKPGAPNSSERTMKELSPRANARSKPAQKKSTEKTASEEDDFATVATFKLPSTQMPADMLDDPEPRSNDGIEVLDLAASSPRRPASKFPPGIDPLRPFAAFAKAHSSQPASQGKATQTAPRSSDSQRTPKKGSRKRPPPDLSSPALSQRTITSYYSPSPQKTVRNLPFSTQDNEIVNLISSSPAPFPAVDEEVERPLTPTPQAKSRLARRSASPTPRQCSTAVEDSNLPESVTKRRRKEPLKRWPTEPVGLGMGSEGDRADLLTLEPGAKVQESNGSVEMTVVISSSPAKSDGDLMNPSKFVTIASRRRSQEKPADWEQDFAGEGGFIRDNDEAPSITALPIKPPQSSYPTPPSLHEDSDHAPPPIQSKPHPVKTKAKSKAKSKVKPANQPHPANKKTKTCIVLRKSLQGAWKEVPVEAESEMLDMTGDGSGWKKGGGKPEIWSGWRKSEVEVLDLTGA